MKKKLESILVCPLCKGPLVLRGRGQKELVCEKDKLAYPVRRGVPVLLHADARSIDD
ncbi:MAG TPA: Trm112 family protein [Gammaproteobacteria bacterium]|nr:Trm112 family protein [Gammaproteobacteria bacterium]